MSNSPVYPRRFPLFRFVALSLSLAALAWFVSIWQRGLEPVQRYDLPAYIRTTLPEVPYWTSYSLAVTGRYLAIPGQDFTLSASKYDHDKLRAWLQENVYETPLWLFAKWPLGGFAILLILTMAAGWRLDRSMNAEARDGRVIRGPQLISHFRWNLRTWRRRTRGFYIETR